MRNGDNSQNRFQALSDSVNLISGAKTRSNPENTVGVMTMARKGPVNHDKKQLEMTVRKLKKNSVALDIVNFGEEDDGKPEKLEALLAAVNNNDTSHIVHVPSSANAVSDVLIGTPIFTGDGGCGSGFVTSAAAAGGVSGFDLGVDPNVDPELALALHLSMEKERARQEAAAKKAAEGAAMQERGGEQTSSQDATMTVGIRASGSGVGNKDVSMDDESSLLQRALAMSMDDTTSSHHEHYLMQNQMQLQMI